MLFERRFWEPIAHGQITVTFRRWKRRQVVAGNRYRTAAGILQVTALDVVTAADITDADVAAAGYPTAEALLVDLRGSPDLPIYRVQFSVVDEPDPRTDLAETSDLTDDDVAEIDRRLARLDAASGHGSWTRETLSLIASKPAVRAGDLADAVGRERLAFKTDVRKLKNLGLTLSLGTGYRLSPRGEAYLGSQHR